MLPALRRAWEISYLVRAIAWVPITGYVLATDLKNAVWVVIIYSAYANITGDFGAWEACKAKRAARETETR